MNNDVPKGYVAFSLEKTPLTPGRVRLRIPAKRHDRDFFQEAAKQLEHLKDVLETQVNPVTAAILIHHDGETQELLEQIGQLGILRFCRRDQLTLEERGFRPFTRKEKATLEFMIFTGLSLYQFMNGHALSAGTSLATQAQEFWNRIPHDRS